MTNEDLMEFKKPETRHALRIVLAREQRGRWLKGENRMLPLGVSDLENFDNLDEGDHLLQ